LKDGELGGTAAGRIIIGAQHSNVTITVMITTAVDLFQKTDFWDAVGY